MVAHSVEHALALIVQDVHPLEPERVGLQHAYYRTLAEDLIARVTQPPFAASAMDGYAVRAADLAVLPTTLVIVGEAAAGSHYPDVVQPGQAVRILTGAPVPQGADAIVIQENTDRSGVHLTVRISTVDQAHIRPAGGDFVMGQTVLKARRILDARALSLAAACGYGEVMVHRKPRVAILATGDELVPPGGLPAANQIISSNPTGLAALVTAFGGSPILLGIAPDNEADIEACLMSAADADILVTTGGASVGDHDLIRPVLKNMGVNLTFWTLAMRPGKPILFGTLGRQRILGLPGNPVSALITARIFLCPLIAAMLGATSVTEPTTIAILADDLAANGPRQHYMRAVMALSSDGCAVVTPMADQDSSLLSRLADANCLIVRPPNAPAVSSGRSISVLLLDF